LPRRGRTYQPRAELFGVSRTASPWVARSTIATALKGRDMQMDQVIHDTPGRRPASSSGNFALSGLRATVETATQGGVTRLSPLHFALGLICWAARVMLGPLGARASTVSSLVGDISWFTAGSATDKVHRKGLHRPSPVDDIAKISASRRSIPLFRWVDSH
jgi:hypothetical protein